MVSITDFRLSSFDKFVSAWDVYHGYLLLFFWILGHPSHVRLNSCETGIEKMYFEWKSPTLEKSLSCCSHIVIYLHTMWLQYTSLGMYFLLSRTQAGPVRTVKQEQEEISRNHVQTFSGCSVRACGPTGPRLHYLNQSHSDAVKFINVCWEF